jgi:anti-sigma28 factor (negative regulator of flagellin synthesis)
MKNIGSQKVLTFPAQSAVQPTVSIHPDLWADAIRPTDNRDLRLDKIAALRAAIAAGAYRVSATDLAEKLIEHMRENA